jgi:hypothetical protein
MQLNIFNAQTNCHVSICKNVGVASKKAISIARFLLNAEWTKVWENSFASNKNSFSVWNFFKIFSLYILIIVVHGWAQIHASICKIKGRGFDLMIKFPLKKFKKKIQFDWRSADRSLTLHKINAESLNSPRILKQNKKLVLI